MPKEAIIQGAAGSIKTLQNSLNGFLSKEADGLTGWLDQMRNDRTELVIETKGARDQLKALSNQYAITKSDADGLKMQLAQENYDALNKQLNDANQKVATVEKGMSSQGALGNLAQNMLAQQLIKDWSQISGQVGQYYFGSKYGAEAGNIGSDILSSTAMYAGIGMLTGSLTVTLVAGSIGALIGGFRSAIENAQNRDDAFKDVVASEYERVTQLQDAMLQSGIAIAAQREASTSFFEKFRQNGKAAAIPDYLNLQQTVNNRQDDMNAAAGKGFIEERKQGLKAQADWLGGPQGQKMAEGNELIGQYKASLENDREQAIRDATDAAMATREYKDALATGNGAEAGRILMEAQVKAENEYKKSEGYQLYLETEKTMVTDLRADLSEGWENFGYTMSQQFTYGLERGKIDHWKQMNPEGAQLTRTQKKLNGVDEIRATQAQYGEDVLKILHSSNAQPNASDRKAGVSTVNVSGNTFYVREEADIGLIAAALANNIVKASMLYAH